MFTFNKPSPALVLAFVALFAALAGGAYAATAAKNSVKTKSIKNLAVTNPKLAPDAVTGDKVLDNTLTGADIDESSVGKVPSAAEADNASKLGGELPGKFQRSCEAGTVKGSIVIDTSTLPADTNYHDAAGFNCASPGNVTSSVQIRKTATNGTYFVKFVGNTGTGSAISSGGAPNGAPPGDGIIVDNEFQLDGGVPAFLVEVHRATAAGTGLASNEQFSLLAF
jgi:hypothetical protein